MAAVLGKDPEVPRCVLCKLQDDFFALLHPTAFLSIIYIHRIIISQTKMATQIAIARAKQSLSDYADLYGTQHALTLDLTITLSCLYFEGGYHSEAEDLIRQVIRDLVETRGEDDILTVQAIRARSSFRTRKQGHQNGGTSSGCIATGRQPNAKIFEPFY